jgi:hypothetical protein
MSQRHHRGEEQRSQDSLTHAARWAVFSSIKLCQYHTPEPAGAEQGSRRFAGWLRKKPVDDLTVGGKGGWGSLTSSTMSDLHGPSDPCFGWGHEGLSR